MVDRTLDETLAIVTANSGRTGSVLALLKSYKERLADALSGVTLPPAVQAKVNAIFDIEEPDAVKIDDALNEGVPPHA